MKYLFYSFLIYWIYNRFFAPPPVPRHRDNDYDTPPPRQTAKNKPASKDDGEFIDYEEVK